MASSLSTTGWEQPGPIADEPGLEVTPRAPQGMTLPPELASYSAALLALPEVQDLEKIAAAAPPIPEYDALLTA